MRNNTTGKPDTRDYLVGRGIMKIAKLDATTKKPLGFRDIGNVFDFVLRTTDEKLAHQSSRGGLKITDKEITISRDSELSFKADELSLQNLALFLSGDLVDYTNPTRTAQAAFLMIPDGALDGATWWNIVNAAGARAYDFDTTTLTVTDNQGAPVSYALGVDYEIVSNWGQIYFIPTSAKVIATIAAGKGIKIAWTADATAQNLKELRGLVKTPEAVCVHFIAVNAADNGDEAELVFHQTTLSSDGDLSLIGDTWGEMGFTGKAESNVLASPNSPTLTIRKLV